MKKLFVLMFLCLPILWACEQDITDRKPIVRTFEQDGLRFSLSLQTENGTNATVFKEGENVVSSLTVENLTGDTVYMYDAYPFPGSSFGEVFSAADGHCMGQLFVGDIDMFVSCGHIAPGGKTYVLTYPAAGDEAAKVSPLVKGEYYVEFTREFQYHTDCICNSQMSSEELQQLLHGFTISGLKINFEVK